MEREYFISYLGAAEEQRGKTKSKTKFGCPTGFRRKYYVCKVILKTAH